MNKRLFCILLMTFILLLSINPSWASVQSENIRVYVDGKEVIFPDQRPVINQDNRTLVPVRFVSEALGAEVEWKPTEQKVEVKQSSKNISLKIGERKATVGNQSITFDTVAEIRNSRTLVPLRFVSEALGAGVEWNGQNRTIYITTSKKDVKSFTGRPFSQREEMPTSKGYDIPFANEPGARGVYINVDELPMQVGGHKIYSFAVDNSHVHIRQETDFKSPVSLFIVEDGYITRSRNYGDGQKGVYTYSYPLTLQGEIADGAGKAEKTKIEAFVLYSLNSNADVEMLVIQNPHYKGGN